jgi:hypothetical protein
MRRVLLLPSVGRLRALDPEHPPNNDDISSELLSEACVRRSAAVADLSPDHSKVEDDHYKFLFKLANHMDVWYRTLSVLLYRLRDLAFMASLKTPFSSCFSARNIAVQARAIDLAWILLISEGYRTPVPNLVLKYCSMKIWEMASCVKRAPDACDRPLADVTLEQENHIP